MIEWLMALMGATDTQLQIGESLDLLLLALLACTAAGFIMLYLVPNLVKYIREKGSKEKMK